jgi:site-specific DNA recombinase
LAETLTAFLGRLRSSSEWLDVVERQRIVRLLVDEILVGDDAISICHSIPVANNPPDSQEPPKSSRFGTPKGEGYLLRSGRSEATAGQHLHEPLP